MCSGCYQERGSPEDQCDLTDAVVSLIKAIYRYHPCGGHCHIVLDDWNLGDSSIQFCIDWIGKARLSYPDAVIEDQGEGMLVAEMACMQIMMQMNEAQRATALAIAEGMYGRS